MEHYIRVRDSSDGAPKPQSETRLFSGRATWSRIARRQKNALFAVFLGTLPNKGYMSVTKTS